MSQQDKSRYYKALQAAGVQFTKHYREYTTAELEQACNELQQSALATEPADITEEAMDPAAAAFFGLDAPGAPEAPQPPPQPQPQQQQPPQQQPQQPPVREADPEEFAGQRLNTKPLDEPIRTDEKGRVWFQEEVRKPAMAKPRGRRILRYTDTGTKSAQVTLEDGTTETFEVAGTQQREAEVKITLPSYQVGIYKDPRFPFRVFTYNSVNGFDLFEVQAYYGGPELVPADIKRMYVSNVLCYDIRTTVRAIEAEYRQHQLTGRI